MTGQRLPKVARFTTVAGIYFSDMKIPKLSLILILRFLLNVFKNSFLFRVGGIILKALDVELE